MLATGDGALDQRVIPWQGNAQRSLDRLAGHAFVSVEVDEDMAGRNADADVLREGKIGHAGHVRLPALHSGPLLRLVLALGVDQIDWKNIENV